MANQARPYPKSAQLARYSRKHKRYVATRAGWEELRAVKLAGQSCRVCRVRPATNLHHLVPRSRLGDDVEANLVGVCGTGITGCHGLLTMNDPHSLRLLQDSLTMAEIAYCTSKLGAAALERLYGLQPTNTKETQ